MGRTKRRKKLKANCRLISMNMRELWNVSQMAHISLYWQYDIDKMNMLCIASSEKKSVWTRVGARGTNEKWHFERAENTLFAYTCDISEMYIQHKKGTHISHWIMLSIYYIFFPLLCSSSCAPRLCVIEKKEKCFSVSMHICVFAKSISPPEKIKRLERETSSQTIFFHIHRPSVVKSREGAKGKKEANERRDDEKKIIKNQSINFL